MKIAIYAGSFDPITNGHLDIIIRAANLFDEVHVLVTKNIDKNHTFTSAKRVEMVKVAVKDLKNVIVDETADLVVRYVEKVNANVIIRGLRNIKDFESEISLYHYNKILSPEVETVILFPSHMHTYLSSSFIKELVYYNVDISPYVPKELVEPITKGIKKSFNK